MTTANKGGDLTGVDRVHGSCDRSDAHFQRAVQSAEPAGDRPFRLAPVAATGREGHRRDPAAVLLPVPSVEQALVGLRVLAGVSPPDRRPLQLGVRRDRDSARCCNWRSTPRLSWRWWPAVEESSYRTRSVTAWARQSRLLAAFGVSQAARVPRLKDVAVRIEGLPPQFEGYTMLQLTDLHISRLFPAKWARAVVDRSNALGVDLIVVTGRSDRRKPADAAHGH